MLIICILFFYFTMISKQQCVQLKSEIKIHRTLHHKHVVQFSHNFEDDDNYYIILELCTNYTLSELIKRRKRVSEVEMRYYLLQMLSGMEYLHAQNVIHRDLKLGNLFLTGNMEIKIGDFGLATRVDFKDQRRTTMCGTPNYIAPEILMGKCGHSFEVDIWSIGVVVYTMLVGKPPYETSYLFHCTKKSHRINIK